ncbi:hypothetical protein [Sorangium cellulosum]|uniref:hypothetical protein n=1 Tax=Sorangium cellulosum TaxID=56 RepID=UPI00187D7969|nr:hypothetical protein [Sorangium cellulosum]
MTTAQSGRSARPTASLPKCAQSTCACSPGSVRSRWNAYAGFLGRRRPITPPSKSWIDRRTIGINDGAQ